ncbi:internalin, partial [Listeria ivanovii]
GKDYVLFSGVVIQPLELATSANEKVSINQTVPESRVAEALKKLLRK